MKQALIIFLITIFLIGCYDSDQKKPTLITDVLQDHKNSTQVELEKIKAEKEVKIATIKKDENTQVATIKKEETIEKTKMQESNKEKEIQLKKEQFLEDTAFKEKVFIFSIVASALLIALFLYLFHRSKELKLQIERERINSEQHMNELNMKKDMMIALIQKIDPEDKESCQKLISMVNDEKPKPHKLIKGDAKE